MSIHNNIRGSGQLDPEAVEPDDIPSREALPKLWNEAAEHLTYVDGVPVLVRLLIEDKPAGMENDAPSGQPVVEIGASSIGDSQAGPSAPANATVLRAGALELDLIDRTAKRGGREIDLRPREFQLLKYMMQRSEQLLTRATLLKEVWKYRFVPETNLVDVHMGRLRRKVDAPNDHPMIRNVRGVGFILNAAPSWPIPSAKPGSVPVTPCRDK